MCAAPGVLVPEITTLNLPGLQRGEHERVQRRAAGGAWWWHSRADARLGDGEVGERPDLHVARRCGGVVLIARVIL
jgi:hypothetical protein